jgi:hypothetical protein
MEPLWSFQTVSPRNPVNNLFGECAGLGSLASSLLAGKGYGKDVL